MLRNWGIWENLHGKSSATKDTWNFMRTRKMNPRQWISSCLGWGEDNFSIRRQRAALECPTFPVNPQEFRVPEVCLAAILDSRTTHGASGNVFDKIEVVTNKWSMKDTVKITMSVNKSSRVSKNNIVPKTKIGARSSLRKAKSVSVNSDTHNDYIYWINCTKMIFQFEFPTHFVLLQLIPD